MSRDYICESSQTIPLTREKAVELRKMFFDWAMSDCPDIDEDLFLAAMDDEIIYWGA